MNPDAYYHVLKGAMYESQDADESALREYRAALVLEPRSAFLRDNVVGLLLRSGKLDEAKSVTEEGLRLDPRHIQSLVMLANAYTVSGNAQEGVRLLKRAQAASPKDPEPYLGLAAAYANLGQIDRAIDSVQKALEIDPNNVFGLYSLGRLKLAQQKYDEGIAALKTTIELRPAFESAYLNLGHAYEMKGDLVRARSVYQSLLEDAGSNSREAYGAMVALLLKQKAYDDALEVLETWMQKDPSNLDIYLKIGFIYSEKKEYPKAIQVLGLAIERDPKDVRLRFYRGSLYEENKEYDPAEAEYRGIVQLDPNNIDARLRLASLYYYQLKKPDQAIDLAKEASKIDSNRPEPYLVLGLIYFQSEDYEKAAKTFQDGVVRNPRYTELHFHLGATYDKLHRFDEMVAEMNEVLRIDPEHANALNYLGYSYADRGENLNAALDLIQRALKLKGDDGYFLDSLAWVYFKMGETEKALDQQKRAIALVPDDPVIHEHMGDIYLKLKMTKEAREEWIRSLELDPKNQDLAERFRGSGFGDPQGVESIRRALERSKSATEIPIEKGALSSQEQALPAGTPR